MSGLLPDDATPVWCGYRKYEREEMCSATRYSLSCYRIVTTLLPNSRSQHMDYIPRENAIELRDMELDKLNQMELSLQKKLRSGSPQAVNAAIRIMQHRATLMGLDRIENNDGLDGAKAAMDAIVAALLKGPVAQPVEDDNQDD